jgi:DNA-binding NtrC family response regulator
MWGWGERSMIEDTALQRVLVVDDEQIIADTLSVILGLHGYAAQTAYSGEDAVAAAKVFRPDVVISGFVLPGMSGLASSLEIHRAIPGCRLIFVSGSARLHEILIESGYKGMEVLEKPVHPERILELLAAEIPAIKPSRGSVSPTFSKPTSV